MGVQNVCDLSIGQWSAICRAWNAAHGGSQADAPSEDEFERAVMRARGVV